MVRAETLPLHVEIIEADSSEKDYSQIPDTRLRQHMYRYGRVISLLEDDYPFPWDDLNVRRFVHAFLDFNHAAEDKLVAKVLDKHILDLKKHGPKHHRERMFEEPDLEAVIALALGFEEVVYSVIPREYKDFFEKRKKQLGNHPINERIDVSKVKKRKK